MGASTSTTQDAKSAEDATVEEREADLSEIRDDDSGDAKQLQKNGQISISSLNAKSDEQTDVNGHGEDDTLAEVGQTDAMPQKEESPEMTEELQEEVCPKVNGEQEENESVDKITAAEEKAEEKPSETNEVGFKKIFRFVGFKFTLKKDKNEKTEPVQLLTVKETENVASESATEETKEEAITGEAQLENEIQVDAEETDKNATIEVAIYPEAVSDLPSTNVIAETTTDGAAGPKETPADQPSEETVESPENEKEPTSQAEAATTSPSQETQSPLRKFFTQGIFSNLRKKTSFKKSKEEEIVKEKSVEEDIKETEEKEDETVIDGEQVKDVEEDVTTGEQVQQTEAKEKTDEVMLEEAQSTTEEQKEQALNVEPEGENKMEPAQEAEPVAKVTTCEVSKALPTDAVDETKTTDDKPTDDKVADSTEQEPEKPSGETTTETEVVSSQDKAKPQGSPLKKLFTGAGLKKLSSKKTKAKKETDSKLRESDEYTAEQMQSFSETTEAEKHESGASSPEESAELTVGEGTQAEANVEADGEAATSDSEKKKDGILPWASFKKLVTPKKRVKQPSESEDEATGDKPKSATMSSTDSAVFDEKIEEVKQSEDIKDEAKEESQIECKTETKAEKSEHGTEEPKRKMDTSVSWEALICVGSAKKRARKTSDSDEEEAKMEEEVQKSGEEQTKTVESTIASSQEADHENLASSPEPDGELVSTWESFKRLVTQRKKPKAEDKSDDGLVQEQATSDSEIPKEESSFSLRKLIPRRKKKSDTKQGQASSSDVGSAEEDSDTPAVVPLSEYDNEQSEKPSATVAETEETKPEVTPVTPAKASVDERAPSWISATVEDVKDDADEKQLSDIPEEGDTAATPKSTDNTIAEDIAEFTSEAVTALEPAEETEMVSALSRITESPDTSGETSPVSVDGVMKKTEAIFKEADENISDTSAMPVTVTEEQTKTIAVSTSPVSTESGIKEKAVELVVHEKSEATAICTSLNTSEIKVVEEDKAFNALVEAVATVSEAMPVEMASEDQNLVPEEAAVADDKVFTTQINKVHTEYKEQPEITIGNAVEKSEQGEAVVELSVAQTVNELQEVTPVKVAMVTAVHQEAETLEILVLAKNSLKLEDGSSIEPSIEESACTQTVEVTELAVAKGECVQELKDVEESVASAEVAPVESAMAVTDEVTTFLKDAPINETLLSQVESITVVAPEETFAVTKEITYVISSTESKTEEVVAATVLVEEHIQVASSSIGDVIEKVSEQVQKEIKLTQAMHAQEAEAIQEKSTVIVHEVIQSVVENLGEMCEKHIEKELEGPKPVEVPTISDTPEDSSKTVVVVEEERSSSELIVEEVKSVQDENATTDASEKAIIEKSLLSKPTDKADQEQAQIITERSPAAVSEAIQVSETFLVAMTEETKVQQEVALVSVEPTQQSIDVVQQVVELKESKEKVLEEKMQREDEISQVTENGNVLTTQAKQETTETPTSEAKRQKESCQLKLKTATVVSTSQTPVLEVASQEVQSLQIEKTTEISIDIVHIVDADEKAKQDTKKEDSSKGQEPLKDMAERVLDQAQKDTLAQDMKAEEGSDTVSQISEAKSCEVKMATEATANAIKEEEVGNEIDPITTETATLS